MTASGRSARSDSSLAERRHEESTTSGAPKRWRGFGHAKPVSVGLDHGRAFGGAGKLAQVAVIGGKRAEIDGEERRLAGTALGLAHSAGSGRRR